VEDRDLLALAVFNLVENALKFTYGKEAVEVRALEDGKAIVIEIADSGPGIPPDELSKIFEELYRGANARGIEGSGLGLALAQRIVELRWPSRSAPPGRPARDGFTIKFKLKVTGLRYSEHREVHTCPGGRCQGRTLRKNKKLRALCVLTASGVPTSRVTKL
jgi:K+-sensing histidine kinase KdpD